MSDGVDFSKYNTQKTSVPSADASSSSGIDFSKYGGNKTDKTNSSVDFSKYASNGSAASSAPPVSPAPSTGWNGILDNPIGRWTGANALADLVGGKVNQFENWSGINKVSGAARNLINTASQLNNPNIDNMTPEQREQSRPRGAELWNAIVQGFNNPDQANQNLQQGLQTSAKAGNWSPLQQGLSNFVVNAGTDPLSYVPVGGAAKLAGNAIKGALDGVGATPYIAKAANAVVNAPYIQPAIQGTQDVLGKMFVKNYGATPALADMIDNTRGTQAVNENAIISSLKDLSQGHNLTPDELSQTGHVVEGTMPGTPEQQAYAQQWSNLADHGPQMPAGSSPIGTQAMLNTASAVNGEPLLRGQIDNHFMHMYDNVPKELQGMFPKKDYSNGSGLSPDGSFNKPRTYDTLQDAQNAGLKPVLDPHQVLGQQLKQSSDALTNNSLLQQVKNEPGLLLPQDKIDELYKLLKTGRMDSPQVTAAMQAMGLTEKDLTKGGIVQSKIPQLSGYYIRKADEAALQDHLNPAKPTGFMGAANSTQNLYNKGYLLNPLPHMHNIGTNGVVLGGAGVDDIADAVKNIKNGTEPMYQRALKSGAISNPVGGSFSDAISRAVAPTDGNILSRTINATKGAAADIVAGNGKLLDNLKAPFQPLKDASHDALWNTDAAIRTTLFKNAVNGGATDAEAAAHTNKFMVDYNNLTPFERKFVKPIIPFYAWKKGNLPMQAGQTLAQTPKYMAMDNINNAVSQAVSGQPTDQKGRINSGQKLADGSTTMVDPYISMHDVSKIGDKGLLPYLYNSLSPGIKEGINQGASLAQFFGAPVQSKFPIYNNQAPFNYNLRAGLAHAINALNPFNGSAILGEAGSQSNFINSRLGVPLTNPNAPGETPLELITKLAGGFTARSNPSKDAINQYYQNKDNAVNFKKYMRVQAKVNANN